MKSSAKTPNPLSRNPNYNKSVKVMFSNNHPHDFVLNFSPSLFRSHLDRDEAVRDLELRGLALCEKVRRKLGDNGGGEAYVGFLKMLHDQDMGFVELQMLVSDLVGGCPVIMKELDKFLQACEDWELEIRYNRGL